MKETKKNKKIQKNPKKIFNKSKNPKIPKNLKKSKKIKKKIQKNSKNPKKIQKIQKVHKKPQKYKNCQKWSTNPKVPKKKCYSHSFPILGGRDSTRALQFTLFQNPGGGSPECDEGQTEILVSNIG